ncbi:hypothetical protein, partial [Novosphingobium sp. 18050]
MTPTQYAVLKFIYDYHRDHDGGLPTSIAVQKATARSEITVLRAIQYLDAQGFLQWGRAKLGRPKAGTEHTINVVLT